MCRQTCHAVLYGQHVSGEAKINKWHDLNLSQQFTSHSDLVLMDFYYFMTLQSLTNNSLKYTNPWLIYKVLSRCLTSTVVQQVSEGQGQFICCQEILGVPNSHS